ncbi:uncharacterized protein [Magallana gigas]|uniref:uncharacterized protein isoform X2 n=1 Tax=Magallana gigas TaxID=29159 RepID=UPI00333FB6AF
MAAFIWLVCLFISLDSGRRMTDATLATPATTKTCYDALGRDCFRYKDTDCVGTFETWARANCSLRCGYCPQKLPCEDDLDYCHEFGKEVCNQEQYGQYMREHCRKFCNLCKAPTEYLVSGTLPTTTPEPTTTTTAYNPASEWCRDNSTLNCWYYPDEKCVGAYENWSRVYCPYRCGYCPNFYPPCEDLDSNCVAFRNGSCTDTRYRAYMREHCRRHCNECHYPGQNLNPISPPLTMDINTSASTVNTPSTKEACYDVLGRDCFRYKDTDCVGPFETWARANCSLRCGYCPQKLPCEDDLDYCNEFGKEICNQEQYGQYMREHCRKFCNFCKAPTEYLVSSTLPTTTPEPTTTTTAYNPASEWCRDNSTLNCWYYPDEKCVGAFEGWARVYCPYRCGYCPNFHPPCEDLDSNCAAFRNGSCTDTRYRAYMREHCRNHCDECTYPGQGLTPISPPDSVFISTTPASSTPAVEPTLATAGPGSSTSLALPTGEDCKDAMDCSTYSSESCVGVFKTWAIKNCPRTCDYCTGTTDCRDYEECEKLPDDVCSNPTYRRIAETSCRKFCKLCTVPTKPVVTGTTEAMMVPTKAPVSEVATGHQTDQTTTEIVSMELSQAGSEVVSAPTKPAASEVMTSASSLTTHQAMSTTPGLMCPECDTHFNCVWNRVCYPGEVCMLRQYPNYPFSVHCSKKADCIFMKMNLKGADILCCEEHTCITDIIP